MKNNDEEFLEEVEKIINKYHKEGDVIFSYFNGEIVIYWDGSSFVEESTNDDD